jgi:signal transduction histidine kinase
MLSLFHFASFGFRELAVILEIGFWQTTWFRIFRLTGCLLMVVFLYRLRMFHVTRQLNARFQDRLAERTRIAQELHDTLLQSFQGLMLRFQTANEMILSSPVEAKDCLERALDRADLALAESRKAIQGIRSGPSVGLDLEDSLNAVMSGLLDEMCLTKAQAPNTSVVAEGQLRTMDPWIADEVCRIAREALWNALAHSRARRIESEIAYSEKFLRIRFRDDGVGIDPAILRNGGRAGHWGITGMNERAKAIHGRLSIWSKPGAGTEVELTIPAYIAYGPAPSQTWFRRSRRKVKAA